MPMPPLSGGGIAMPTAARLSGGPRTLSASKRRKEPPGPAGCTRREAREGAARPGRMHPPGKGSGPSRPCREGCPGSDAQPSGFPCGEQAPNLEPGHVASKYVVARSVAKCLSDLRTVPVA